MSKEINASFVAMIYTAQRENAANEGPRTVIFYNIEMSRMRNKPSAHNPIYVAEN